MTQETRDAVIVLIRLMRKEGLMEFLFNDEKYGMLMLRASEYRKPSKLERYCKKQGITKVE